MQASTALLIAAVVLGAATGCGDDGGGSTEAGTVTTAPAETTTTSTEPAEDDDLCSTVAPDEVAAASGQEIVGTTPTTGTGEVQGVAYQTAGCTYDVEPDGGIEVQVLVDETGATAGGEVFADLHAASVGLSPNDDFPHEDVSGLGEEAFFLRSLLSNQLFVDTGSVVLLIEGEIGDEEAPRAMLRDVADVAVVAIG